MKGKEALDSQCPFGERQEHLSVKRFCYMSRAPQCSLMDSQPPTGTAGLLSRELDHSKLSGLPQKSASKFQFACLRVKDRALT